MTGNLDSLVERERLRENIEDGTWSRMTITEIRKCHYFSISHTTDESEPVTWEKYIVPESASPKISFLQEEADSTSTLSEMSFPDGRFSSDGDEYKYEGREMTLFKLESIPEGFNKYVKLSGLRGKDPESLLGQTVIYGEKNNEKYIRLDSSELQGEEIGRWGFEPTENAYQLTKIGFVCMCFLAGPLFYFFTGFGLAASALFGFSALSFGAFVSNNTPSLSLDRAIVKEDNVENFLDTTVSVTREDDNVNTSEEDEFTNTEIVTVSVEGFDDGTVQLTSESDAWTFESNKTDNTMSEEAREVYMQYSEDFTDGEIPVLIKEEIEADELDDSWIISDSEESALLSVEDADEILHDKINSKELALN